MFRISKAAPILAMSAVLAFTTLLTSVVPVNAAVTTSKTVHVKPHIRLTKRFTIQHVKGYYKTTKTTRVSGYTRTDKNGHIVHVKGYDRNVTIIGKHKTM